MSKYGNPAIMTALIYLVLNSGPNGTSALQILASALLCIYSIMGLIDAYTRKDRS